MFLLALDVDDEGDAGRELLHEFLHDPHVQMHAFYDDAVAAVVVVLDYLEEVLVDLVALFDVALDAGLFVSESLAVDELACLVGGAEEHRQGPWEGLQRPDARRALRGRRGRVREGDERVRQHHERPDARGERRRVRVVAGGVERVDGVDRAPASASTAGRCAEGVRRARLAGISAPAAHAMSHEDDGCSCWSGGECAADRRYMQGGVGVQPISWASPRESKRN